MAAPSRFVKVFAAAALLVSALVSGCTSSSDGGLDEADLDNLSLESAPVLYLNLTIGNETHRFSTAPAATGTATGGNSSTTTVTSGNSTAAGNATQGNATAGNATGNATAVAGSGELGGPVPLNVSATLGASGLPSGQLVSWTLDFGDADAQAGNATAGNGTAGNATAGNGTSSQASGPSNGTKVPATVEHTYTEAGTYDVSLAFRLANGTPQVLRATLTVTGAGNLTDTTASGPLPEPIVIEGSTTGVDSEPSGNNDETFELLVPVSTMTITLDFGTIACAQGVCGQDLDWSIAGPGGEEGGGANFGPEDPAVFEAPTPGIWTVTVIPFVAVDTSYTITVTFA